MTNRSEILLVDGMALLFRAFYATAVTGQFMINTKGVPTNAIHGFVKHMMTAIHTFQPTHVAVCWDMGSKTFRSEIYPEYKGNRSEPPIELVPQFDIVKNVVSAFDIPNIGLSGYEADDCIGTLAKYHSAHANVKVLTGDQDILQLLHDTVHVALLKKGFGNYEVFTKEYYYEQNGIYPTQLIDLKAMMGDASDHYPGVRGIGEKTALKLLQQYETIEQILVNLPQLTKSQRQKFEDDLEMLHLSRKLAEIKCDVPISCELDEMKYEYAQEKVEVIFEELELKGLHKFLSRFNG